jgi:hypothetical protein
VLRIDFDDLLKNECRHPAIDYLTDEFNDMRSTDYQVSVCVELFKERVSTPLHVEACKERSYFHEIK